MNVEMNDRCYTCKRPKPFASICPVCSGKAHIFDHFVSVEDYRHKTPTHPEGGRDE